MSRTVVCLKLTDSKQMFDGNCKLYTIMDFNRIFFLDQDPHIICLLRQIRQLAINFVMLCELTVGEKVLFS